MKWRKTINNWRLTEMDKRIYLPLEPIHLQLDLHLDLQKIKHKSPLYFFAHVVYRSPDAWLCKWYLRPMASVLFFLVFNIAYVIYFICAISHLQYISHMRYLTFTERICDTSLLTLALCLGLGYSERTINNAYAFLIYTSEVCFRFLK